LLAASEVTVLFNRLDRNTNDCVLFFFGVLCLTETKRARKRVRDPSWNLPIQKRTNGKVLTARFRKKVVETFWEIKRKTGESEKLDVEHDIGKSLSLGCGWKGNREL